MPGRTSITTPPAALDLRPLRYLLTIVEEGSLAAAAVRLGVTQPALSRSLQALEQAIGQRVLDRGKAGVVPTAAGRLLVERGHELLADVRALTHELDLLAGAEQGLLRIAAGIYPAEISVGQAVARLIASRPALRVRISVRDWPQILEGVLAEKFDIGVCELSAAQGDPRLVLAPLQSHPGVLFCRSDHPLAGARSVAADEVRRFPLVLSSIPERVAQALGAWTAVAADSPEPGIQVDTFGMLRTIVLGSDAIGAATRSQLEDDLSAGRLIVLPIELPRLQTGYGFVQRAGRTPAPATVAFMAELRAVEASLAGAPAATSAARRKRRKGPAGQARRSRGAADGRGGE
jgi:DNA-binding transcriptional LysR family regulator